MLILELIIIFYLNLKYINFSGIPVHNGIEISLKFHYKKDYI